MKMTDYLAEILFAANKMFEALHGEGEQLKQLEAKLDGLTRETEAGYARAEALQQIADMNTPPGQYDDDAMMGVGVQWETYFGPDKERHHTNIAVQAASSTYATHAFSRGAIAGTLLQYGKQGISIVHGGLKAPPLQVAPLGRLILGEPLKNVIWQGRNQALHWEEGNFKKPVIDCFEKLKQGDARFAPFLKQSMAAELVDVLGWKVFAEFERDMMSLA
jgi:hypothetical protein